MNFTDKDSNKSYLNLQQKSFVNKHDTCMLIQVYLHYLICLCTKKYISIYNCFIPDIIEIKLRGQVYSNFHTRS